MDPIAKLISARKDKLILALQGLTAAGLLLSIILMTHVGPLTLFLFMTVGQALIIVAVIGTSILLVTQRTGIIRERFEPGEIIFQKGDAGENVYIVEDGEVEAIDEEPGKGERVIATLGPGEGFGALALMKNQPRSVTVRSRTAVTLISVDRAGFQALMRYPPLRKLVEDGLKEKLESGTGVGA